MTAGLSLGNLDARTAALVRRVSDEDLSEVANAAMAGVPEVSRRSRQGSSEWLSPRPNASNNIRRMAEEALVPRETLYAAIEADLNQRRVRRNSLTEAERERAAQDMLRAYSDLQGGRSELQGGRPTLERRGTASLIEALDAMDDKLRVAPAAPSKTARTEGTLSPGAARAGASGGGGMAAEPPPTSIPAPTPRATALPRGGLLRGLGYSKTSKAAASAAAAPKPPADAAAERPSPRSGRRGLLLMRQS